jgi:hypothetical protein
MIIITRNPSDTPPDPPVTNTGQPYRYELTYDGDHRRAYADTLTELCGALIEGYDPDAITQRLVDEDIPDAQLEPLVTGELDELRIVHSVGVQVRLQAEINAQAPIDQLPPDKLQLLRSDRVTQPAIDHWDSDVPLVLSAHDYQPDGDLPRPTGDIIWLDPRDESTYLSTLEAAGLIRLAEAIDPTEVPTDPAQ